MSEKIRLDISCESSAGQTIRMKCQTLVSLNILKNKEYFNMSSAAGATISPPKITIFQTSSAAGATIFPEK